VARLLLLRGTIGSGKSSVASWIQGTVPQVAVIEIDEIKRRKYRTTALCNSPVDFRSPTGREARQTMLAGRDTIVVEAFCERQHLDWVLAAANLELQSPNVTVVWLECDLTTSLERKEGVLSPGIVRQQHGRYGMRFEAPCEHVINTTGLGVEAVGRLVLAATSIGDRSEGE